MISKVRPFAIAIGIEQIQRFFTDAFSCHNSFVIFISRRSVDCDSASDLDLFQIFRQEDGGNLLFVVFLAVSILIDDVIMLSVERSHLSREPSAARKELKAKNGQDAMFIVSARMKPNSNSTANALYEYRGKQCPTRRQNNRHGSNDDPAFLTLVPTACLASLLSSSGSSFFILISSVVIVLHYLLSRLLSLVSFAGRLPMRRS